MANERGGNQRARITVIRMMGLIALIAVVLKYPPLVLAALPISLYFGSWAISKKSLIVATALSLVSLSSCVAVGVLWSRSYRQADELAWSLRGARGSFRSSRGHFFGELRPSVDPTRLHPLKLQHTTSDLISPYFDGPDKLDWLLIPPEDEDINSGGHRGGFAWFERRNPLYHDFIDRFAAPFWYLAVLTMSPVLGLATVPSRYERAEARARRPIR